MKKKIKKEKGRVVDKEEIKETWEIQQPNGIYRYCLDLDSNKPSAKVIFERKKYEHRLGIR